jgi:hypothetical protein
MIYQLQKIPTVGEMLSYETYELTVESADGPRLERIQIRRLETADELSQSADASHDDPLAPIEPVPDFSSPRADQPSTDFDDDFLADSLPESSETSEAEGDRPSYPNNHNSSTGSPT